MRMTIVALAATLGAPASAATVASFSGDAEIGFVLESASFVGAPGDAYSYLTRDAVFDEDDSGSTRWNAVVGYHDDLDRFWYNGTGPVFQGLSFGMEGWISGSTQAQSPFGWPGSEALVAAYSYPAFFYDDAFCGAHCDAASSIRLTFSYSLSVSAEASIDGPPGRSTAEATSRASIAFGVIPGVSGFPDGSNGVLFRDRIETSATASGRLATGLFESSSRQGGGIFELTLRPGEYGYADVYLERLSGSATVEPVPLPAGLPLALAGFASLAGLARAKSRRAAAQSKKPLRHCIPARNH